MALKISPRSSLDDMVVGEEVVYSLDVTDELGTDTVSTVTYKVYDSEGTDSTTNYGGGSSVTAGVITFGVIAYAAGVFTLKFIVTCNEFLPNGTTPKEFYVNMSVNIRV